MNTLRQTSLARLVIIISALLLVSSIITLGIGNIAIPLKSILLPHTADPAHHVILWQIRLPRIFMALIAGASLSYCGALMQGLFRNPLVEPGLIGVSSGAALATVIAISISAVFTSFWLLPIAAFIGGLTTMLLAIKLSKVMQETIPSLLLLAGIAINALCIAGLGILLFLADDQQLRAIIFWSMGSLNQAQWIPVTLLTTVFALTLLLLKDIPHVLNAAMLGKASIHHLGFNYEQHQRKLLLLVACIVSINVAFTGVIAFIGLVVPHCVRFMVGSDHRKLLPISALLGAFLLLWADCLARSLAAPADIPIGLITSILGGPFFIQLLLSNKTAAAR